MTAGVGACLLATMVSVPAGAATTPGWRVTSIYGAPLYAVPQGIAAVNANDAWISGTTVQSLLIQRWTNGKWQTLPDPAGFTINGGGGVNDRVIDASSLTNMWTFPEVSTSTTTQYGLGWNGHTWSKFTFKGVQVLDAAAFSPSDVWMFGSKIPSTPVLGFGSPYVVRYNGHAWKPAPTPPGVVLGVDKLSANDIWAYGPTTKTAGGAGTSWAYIAMRWNGTKWLSFSIPKLAPVQKHPWYVNGMVILGDKNVWVSEGVTASLGGTPGPPGVALLHWNGTKWQTVARNSTLFPNGGLAYDGHGGFWLPAAGSGASATEYLVHYSSGRLTQQATPSVKGYHDAAGRLVLIPGTRSLWGLGSLEPTGSGINENAILKFGP
jgi:hypothetical protein